MRAAIFLTAFLAASSAQAKPLALKCTLDTGEKAADLLVDVAANKMIWGLMTYKIIHTNDQYISAYQETGSLVGGEIWVLDRAPGDYKRAAVAMFTDSSGQHPRLRAATFEGRCTKPVL